MLITINGRKKEIPYETCYLTELLRNLNIHPENVMVELNATLYQKKEYAETSVNPGDTLEIVHFMGGGCY